MGIMDLFKKKTSGNVAKDRLKLVLVSDRANCSSEMMEMMKNDIIEVISRYMDIDAEALDVKITETESDSNNGTVPALVANIPIRILFHCILFCNRCSLTQGRIKDSLTDTKTFRSNLEKFVGINEIQCLLKT